MSRDAVCGAIGLVLAAAYYAAATALPVSLLSDEVGAGGIPKALAVCLGVTSALLLVRALAFRPAVGPLGARAVGEALRHVRALGLIAVGFIYMVAAAYIGYPLAIALLIVATVVYFGQRPNLQLVAVAAGGAVFLWAMFVRMLNVPMPVGLWPRLFG